MLKTITKYRASAILFDLLKSNENGLPWLLPANCCPIVPLTFLKAQVQFDLIDIDFDSLCADENKALEKLGQHEYGGLLWVDTYGTTASPFTFFKRVKEQFPETIVIHDKCLSKPTMEHLDFVDLTLYSTGYAKFADVSFGGYAMVNSTTNYTIQNELPYSLADLKDIETAYKKAFAEGALFHYKDSQWLNNQPLAISEEDYFLKVNEAAAKSVAYKQKLNAIYAAQLPPEIQLKENFQHWRFHILVNEKEELLKSIFANKLFASSHYQSLGTLFNQEPFPVTDFVASHIVNLFNDSYIIEEQVVQLCKIITVHCYKHGAISNAS